MFNQEKDVRHFKRNLLVSHFMVCSDDLDIPESELPAVMTRIQEFVASLTDFDHAYLANLNKLEWRALTALVIDANASPFLINRQLDMLWIFGYKLNLKEESDEIRERITHYNAPWGKDVTLSLAALLSQQPLQQFVKNEIISFHDLRAWDKGRELGTTFVFDVLTFLSENASKVKRLLDKNVYDKTSLHEFFFAHGKQGLSVELLRKA